MLMMELFLFMLMLMLELFLLMLTLVGALFLSLSLLILGFIAAIVGLESIKGEKQQVTVYSDSKYVVDSINKKWVFGWVKKGFKDKKNPDLWKRFLKIYPKHNVTFKWVKGHAGHPENERCDVLAVQAATGYNLAIDTWYEGNQDKE